MGWISTRKPLSIEWAMEHEAFRAGRRSAEREQMEDTKAKDVDETRRLLYGALAAARTERWELVGTLVNALTHHSGLVSDPYEAMDKLILLVGSAPQSAVTWAKGLIDELTGLLDRPS